MQMPGRHNQYGPVDNSYRFAYNGMEVDNEVSGNGNSYTTEFRQYDPRLGRWKSLDPLMATYPSWSPYTGFENNPVVYNDPSGLGVDDWVSPGEGQEWVKDDRVVDQATAIEFYGDNAIWGGSGTEHSGIDGITITQFGDDYAWRDNFCDVENVEVFAKKKPGPPDVEVPFVAPDLTAEVVGGGGLDETFWDIIDYLNPWVDLSKMDPETKRLLTPIPDAVSIDLELDIVPGMGAEFTLHTNFILKGSHASYKPTITLEKTQSVGYNAGINGGVGIVNKLRGELSPQDFITTSKPYSPHATGSPTYNGSLGLSVFGRASINGSYTNISDAAGFNCIMTLGLQAGFSPPGVSGSGGMSNTIILYNFNK